MSSTFTRWLVHYVPSIDNIQIIESNYIGLSGLDVEDYEDSNGIDQSSTVQTKGYIYVAKDSRVEREISKLESVHKDGISVEKFIFWQTALASGYNPKYIPNYNCCNLSSDKLELYFTVGPLLMVEFFIAAIKDALLILIVFIAFRFRNKSLLPIFKNLSSLKQLLKDEDYKDRPKSNSRTRDNEDDIYEY